MSLMMAWLSVVNIIMVSISHIEAGEMTSIHFRDDDFKWILRNKGCILASVYLKKAYYKRHACHPRRYKTPWRSCTVIAMLTVRHQKENYCCPVANMMSQNYCHCLFPSSKPVLPVSSVVTVARFISETDIWIIQPWCIAFCCPFTKAEWSDKTSVRLVVAASEWHISLCLLYCLDSWLRSQ